MEHSVSQDQVERAERIVIDIEYVRGNEADSDPPTSTPVRAERVF
jgi:hypothetical protein